jgi:alpha-glucosidase
MRTPIDENPHMPGVQSVRPRRWWRGELVYQVYVRSFAGGEGGGPGDFAGLRSRFRYMADLDVGGLWINQW